MIFLKKIYQNNIYFYFLKFIFNVTYQNNLIKIKFLI